MLTTILIIVLILALIGALPTWGYSRSWGYGPGGGLGLILIIVLLQSACVVGGATGIIGSRPSVEYQAQRATTMMLPFIFWAW